VFWDWLGKKPQRPERKQSEQLKLSSGVDKFLPSFCGYDVEVLAPAEAHRVLKLLARRRG
jgi:hypothetical protein